jgi:hypothetical protein
LWSIIGRASLRSSFWADLAERQVLQVHVMIRMVGNQLAARVFRSDQVRLVLDRCANHEERCRHVALFQNGKKPECALEVRAVVEGQRETIDL